MLLFVLLFDDEGGGAMERRIEHLEDRLRALSRALRLRGLWQDTAQVQPERCVEPAPQSIPRLRRRA